MYIHQEKFPTIKSFLDTINSRTENKVFKKAQPASKETDNEMVKFSGTANYEEAEELLKYGWDEHLEEVMKGIKVGVKGNGYTSRRKQTLDVVGYNPCVPRAIQGLPDSMYNYKMEKRKTPTMSILYDLGASSLVKPKQIIQNGIKLLRLINSIEAQGIKVELEVIKAAYAHSHKNKDEEISIARINVKRYKDKLDIKKLMFPLIHPSMLRRIGFRYLETDPKLENSSYKIGYGYSLYNDFIEERVREEYIKYLTGGDKNIIYLNYSRLRDDMFLKETFKLHQNVV